jgi:hypothetical protein
VADLEGDILTLGERAAEQAREISAQILAERASVIVDRARQQWPVKTGRSRAALALELRTGSAKIIDPVGYATGIESNGVNPWRSYVLDPVATLVQKVAPPLIVQALTRALAEGRHG